MAVKGINGADLNNISRVDGRSNVLDKVNGVDADLNAPAVAFSVRNVSGLTGIPYDGPAMRILVDATGDGADATDLEFDINFTADGDLDVADIELKCAGGKDAYVVKWYDQSGAGNDATQTTYADMPKIATAGVVITENGKPALNCDGASVGLDATFTHTVTEQSNFVVAEFVDFSSGRILSQTVTGQNINADYLGTNHYIPFIRNAGNSIASYASGYKAAKAAANNTQQLFGSIHSGTSITNYVNASASSIGSATLNTEFYVLRLKTGGNNEGMDGTLQEVISWSSNQSSPTNNRIGIETDINTYFSIY